METSADIRRRIGQRIASLLTATGHTQTALADFVGVAPQAISQWIAGETAPRQVNLEKVAEFFGILSSEIQHSASFSRQEYLKLETMPQEHELNDNKTKIRQTIGSIEIDRNEASAMLGTHQVGAIKLLTAFGDQMKPTINPKDLLFVDTSTNQFLRDGVYVFEYIGELIVKRLQKLPEGRFAIKSDNSSYETVYIQGLEEIQIVGQVIRSMPMQLKEFV
ncbi:MAG: LexA family transcriptional regulator [Proteobacteria bacterium]|nr:LexA family transcriptional regulator [Cystobacterineae bacterium]MCL2314093.1 LexA family transcriptional regulator [Pseudomonadota bacterium]